MNAPNYGPPQATQTKLTSHGRFSSSKKIGLDNNDSITVCSFTSDPTELPLFRILIEPTPFNGLRRQSRVMADKVSTVPRPKLGRRIGRLSDADMARVDRALHVFLGLAR